MCNNALQEVLIEYGQTVQQKSTVQIALNRAIRQGCNKKRRMYP